MRTSPNIKTFELLGCKAFEIIDEEHIDKTLLISERDLIEFKTSDDLTAKINFYLKDEALHNKITNQGYLTVK